MQNSQLLLCAKRRIVITRSLRLMLTEGVAKSVCWPTLDLTASTRYTIRSNRGDSREHNDALEGAERRVVQRSTAPRAHHADTRATGSCGR